MDQPPRMRGREKVCASEFDGHCVSARRFLIWMDRIEEYYWLVSFFRFEPTLARKQVKMTEKKKERRKRGNEIGGRIQKRKIKIEKRNSCMKNKKKRRQRECS